MYILCCMHLHIQVYSSATRIPVAVAEGKGTDVGKWQLLGAMIKVWAKYKFVSRVSFRLAKEQLKVLGATTTLGKAFWAD